MESFEYNNEELAKEVIILEEEVDRLEKRNRDEHMNRLNKMECLTEPG